MNKRNFFYEARRFVTPVILILLGLILTFSPDSATVLLVQILGWLCIAGAAALVVSALSLPFLMPLKIIGAVLCGCSGIYMVMNPLSLAAWFGRLIGLLLLLQGIQGTMYQRIGRRSLILPMLTALVGVVLMILPMTTSRLVFTIAGLVVLIIGGIMLVDRVKNNRGPREPEDPNIIDAL